MAAIRREPHIDTLEYFENLKAEGIPEGQARVLVKALNASFDGMATKDDLKTAMDTLEKHLKVFFGYLVVGTVLLTFILPLLVGIILKLFKIT